jgi:TonB family protein
VPDQGPSRNPAVGSSRPEYPDAYQDSGRNGTVTVSCTIQTDGRPTGCALVKVVGGTAFGSAVMNWLNSGTAKYSPAIRNGQRVAAPAQLEVHFEQSE